MHSYQLPRFDNAPTAKSVKVVPDAMPITKPFGQWPLWAKALSLLKSDTDAGIGDTVARTIGDSNSAKFKEWYKKTFGKSCGCNARQNKWNVEFPY